MILFEDEEGGVIDNKHQAHTNRELGFTQNGERGKRANFVNTTTTPTNTTPTHFVIEVLKLQERRHESSRHGDFNYTLLHDSQRQIRGSNSVTGGGKNTYIYVNLNSATFAFFFF